MHCRNPITAKQNPVTVPGLFLPDDGNRFTVEKFCDINRLDTVIGWQLFGLRKSVYLVSLHSILRSRLIFLQYVFCGAESAQGAANHRRPLYPRALAAKIAATRSPRLIPTGFGSGRVSVRAKHGPQPASMRAAPAFRERLSDFEATNGGCFSRYWHRSSPDKTRRVAIRGSPTPSTSWRWRSFSVSAAPPAPHRSSAILPPLGIPTRRPGRHLAARRDRTSR